MALNEDGTMAGFFESLHELVTQYRLTKSYVRTSCNTGKLYRGVRWMWNEDYKRMFLEGRIHEASYRRPAGQKPMQRGDRIHGKYPICASTAYVYVNGLLRLFPPGMTLKEIKYKLKTELKCTKK